MKRFYVAITVLALSLAVGVTAMAQGKAAGRAAGKAGCASCDKPCAPPEQLKKFRADSIDLRQEMMTKRFDLERENLKATPDSARVAAIKAEMEAIRAKIDALKTAAKLPASAGCDMEDCPLKDGNCGKCACGSNCSCPDCKAGNCCGKTGKSAKNCAKCSKAADCGCKDCTCKDCKGAGCDKCRNCDKAADCGCSKKGKAATK